MLLHTVVSLTVAGLLAVLWGAVLLLGARGTVRAGAGAAGGGTPGKRVGRGRRRARWRVPAGVLFVVLGVWLLVGARPRFAWLPAPAATGGGTATHGLDRIEEVVAPHVGPGGHVAVVVGILRNGETTVRGFGRLAPGSTAAPDGDTVFAVGSISKVFNGVLLAHLAAEGVIGLDDHVSRHLPEGTGLPPGGEQIRLVDLAAHTAGLPRLPDHMRLAAGELLTWRTLHDPYRGHSRRELYRRLPEVELRAPAPRPTATYSNLGAGLLGHLLEEATGEPWGRLVRRRIAAPLGLESTIDPNTEPVGPSIAARRSPGHFGWLAAGRLALVFPAGYWRMPVLSASGGLLSSAHDLLRFAAATLDPPSGALGTALRDAPRPRAPRPGGGQVGLGWLIDRTASGPPLLWHDGATGGFSSYLAVLPERGAAVVVLTNTLQPVDPIGREIAAVLSRGRRTSPPPPPPAGR